MTIFLDTNIILDILLKRRPYFDLAMEAVDMALDEKVDIVVSASCITDVFYIAKRQGINVSEIKERLDDILTFMDIVSVTKSDILKTLRIECHDFEDALQAQCAAKIKAEYIITRDEGFNGYGVKVVSPKEFIKCLRE